MRRLQWLLPALLAALAAWDIGIGGLGQRFVGGRLANSLLMALAIGPLFWRRRHPVAVLAVVVVACAMQPLVLYGPRTQPPAEPFFALLVAVYSAGSTTDRRAAQRGAALVALSMIGFALPLRTQGAGNVIPAELFLAGAWLLGRAMHRGSRTQAALRTRTAQLEVEAEERARAAALEERARIARELHDVIAHSVSVMVLQASVDRRLLAEREPQTQESLASIERLGREALVELRRLLGVMRKGDATPALAPQPTLQSLPALVDQFRSAGLDVNLVTTGDVPALSPGVQLSAFRIVQEALTNAARHTAARHADVALRYHHSELEIEVISDRNSDGPVRLPSAGHGIIGMRERAALHGGELRALPTPHGFTVRATLNYDDPQ